MNAWLLVTGWTLVHFVWQGTLIGAAAASGLRLLRHASPRARYLTSCLTLASMLVTPLVTARLLSTDTSPATHDTSTQLPIAGGGAISEIPFGDQTLTPLTQALGSVPRVRLTLERALPAIVAVWFVGVVGLFIRLLGGWWCVRRLQRGSLALTVSIWQSAGERIATRLRVVGPIRIVDSDRVDTPTLVGWTRPIILLPIAALANLTPAQVDAILAHELAHIRRHDFLVNLLQTVAEVLLFYHPAVWWVSAQIRTEREHCCDDVAVDVCGDAVGYASALAELEIWRNAQPVLALGLGAQGGVLRERVQRLLRPRIAHDSMPTPVMIAAALVLLCVVIAGAFQGRPVLHASTAAFPDVPVPPAPAAPAISAGPSFMLPAPLPLPPPSRDRAVAAVTRQSPSGTATQSPAFEAVSITANEGPVGRGANVWRTDGRYTVRNQWVRLLVAFAYRVPLPNVSGGPSWIDVDRFDIDAQADTAFQLGVTGITRGPGSEPEALLARVRTLLADQFKLVVHHEMQARPAYALVRANGPLGPHLNPTILDCRAQAEERKRTGILPPPPPWGTQRVCGMSSISFSIIAGGAVSMAQLADILTNRLNQPVVDRTGLSGEFDLDLEWTPEDARRRPPPDTDTRPAFVPRIDPNGPSIFTAVQEQLGLALTSTTEPIDVLVIDQVERPATAVAAHIPPFQRGEQVQVRKDDGTFAEPLLQTVIALPGDRLRIDDAGVHVNEQEVTTLPPRLVEVLPRENETIPTGHIFVAGEEHHDNTTGRAWNLIPLNRVSKQTP